MNNNHLGAFKTNLVLISQGLRLSGRRAMHAGLTCVDYMNEVLAVGTATGVVYLLNPQTAFDGPDYPPVRV
jgi:hypothetical protein